MQLTQEQSKREQLIKQHHEDIQRVSSQREQDLAQSRKEHMESERAFQDKMSDLQLKMDQAIRERESEVREELDNKIKANKSKYNLELSKTHEMVKQRESEIDSLERQLAELTQAKQQFELALQKAEQEISEFQSETG